MDGNVPRCPYPRTRGAHLTEGHEARGVELGRMRHSGGGPKAGVCGMRAEARRRVHA
jgi:hypothetical protein